MLLPTATVAPDMHQHCRNQKDHMTVKISRENIADVQPLLSVISGDNLEYMKGALVVRY